MSCEDYLTLKGVSYISKELESQNLLHGTVDFFNWGFLNIGGFQNITVSPVVSGTYGGQKCRLRPVKDENFSDGQVWEGFRGNWVWETGVSFETYPIRVSGVYVAGKYYTSTDNVYGHYVDYKRGRVVFSGTIPTTSVVTTEFSPRTVTFVDSESPYVRGLLENINNVERQEYINFGSGNWNKNYDIRMELPIVTVTVSPKNNYKPYQIGGGQYINTELNFSVISDNKFYRDQICDIIGRQNEKVYWIPNRGTMKAASGYPFGLDYLGRLVNTPKEYPDIVAETGVGGYRWRQVRLDNTTKRFVEQPTNSLYVGFIKTDAEIIEQSI